MDSSSGSKKGRDGVPPTSAGKKTIKTDESRLHNRNYVRAYRSRRQGHQEELQSTLDKLEAGTAQRAEALDADAAEISIIQTESAALKQKHDDTAIRTLSTEERTEKLMDKVRKLERKKEARVGEIVNDPNYLKFKEDNKHKYGGALGVFFSNDDPETSPHN